MTTQPTIQFTDEGKLYLLKKNGWRSRRIDSKWTFGGKEWVTFAEAWETYAQERTRNVSGDDSKIEPHKQHLFQKLRRRYAEYESAVQAGDDLSMQNAMNAIMDELP